jgi:hypothetical protein
MTQGNLIDSKWIFAMKLTTFLAFAMAIFVGIDVYILSKGLFGRASFLIGITIFLLWALIVSTINWMRLSAEK